MIIDLTHPLSQDTPVYPGDPQFEITLAAQFQDNGYEGHMLTMGTHAGTHIDAPSHMIQDGKQLSEYTIDSFVGRGMCVDVSAGLDIDVLSSADIKTGDIVLINTGMHRRFHEPSYFEDYPVLSKKAVNLLVEKRVKMVGLDTCSADIMSDFPVHKSLLSADILIIENLTNLDALRGMGDFMVYALPLKLALDGSPARVIAK